ncbi:Uncharacterized protein APZ42_022132 [Daphnia magna]|uniref:Uncharacterized protein n=1 Tax=Daphnia magna TaxID=35525 RepID=A0A164W258_9CRUS|nr:Uncharacterized protein APZ42_022132 [Daphnia magna]
MKVLDKVPISVTKTTRLRPSTAITSVTTSDTRMETFRRTLPTSITSSCTHDDNDYVDLR